MRRLLCLWLALAGCSKDIQEQYDKAKVYAMEVADGVPRGWDADAYLLLSEELVSALLTTGLQTALDTVEPVDVGGKATLTPNATIRSLTLLEKASCDECVGFRAKLDGKLSVVAGKVKEEVPFEVTIGASMAFTSRDENGLRVMDVKVRSLDRFELEVGKGVALDLDAALRGWGEALVARMPPYNLGAIGGEELGILDVRLLPEGQGLRVEMLTDAAHGVAVKTEVSLPKNGFILAISEGTLVDIARREAFGLGELALDIYAEPTSLDVEGNRFAMGLRLWRLAGSGWWRDYVVQGKIDVSGKLLRLTPDAAEEIDASDGAALADPLATLGESLILDALIDSAGQSLPGHSATKVDGLGFTLTVRDAAGQGDALVLSGDAALYQPKTKLIPGRKSGDGGASQGGERRGQGSSKGASGARKR